MWSENSKRKHIVDDDVHISSHDEQSEDDDITIASNIVQPAPQILESSYQQQQPVDTNPTVFIKSDDGPFFEFNDAHISEGLRSHTAITRGFPLNNHIISAFHHATMYYNVTNTGAIVKAYDRSDRNVSIHPVNLLFCLLHPVKIRIIIWYAVYLDSPVVIHPIQIHMNITPTTFVLMFYSMKIALFN